MKLTSTLINSTDPNCTAQKYRKNIARKNNDKKISKQKWDKTNITRSRHIKGDAWITDFNLFDN